MKSLPPLNSLAPFEAVVRLGSVTLAAQELHVTHSAVSRQIASLERHFGRVLFVRSGRRLDPTEDARELARAVARAWDTLAMSYESISRRRDRPLVVSCEPTILQRWLLPRLSTLHLGAQIHLSASGGPVDFRAGVDLAIRRDDFAIPEHITSRPLFSEWLGPVCSSEQGADIDSLTRLVTQTRPQAWRDWSDHGGGPIPSGPERVFEHFFLTLQAAASGLGAAIGAYPMVADDLESGRLVAPHGFLATSSSYVCLVPPSPPPESSDFCAWLAEQDGILPPDETRAAPRAARERG